MIELQRIKDMLNEKYTVKTTYGEYTDRLKNILDHQDVVIDGYTFHREQQFGGESMGDDYWVVFSVSKDDEKTFYKIPGYYSSGYGSELETENTFQVKQEERIINIWKEV